MMNGGALNKLRGVLQRTTLWLAGVAALLSAGAAYTNSYWYLEGALPFYIERPTVRVLFSLEQEYEDRTGPFVNLKKDTTKTIQKFDIRTRGFVYHPSFVLFEAELKPEFRQYSQDADNDFKDRVKTNFLGYLLDTTWLQEKPYTINLFASKDRNDVSNTLSTDTLTESTIYRGRLMLDYPVLPTTVTAQRTDVITSGFYRSVDKQEGYRIESKQDTLNSTTTLDIDIRTTDRIIRGSATTTDRSSGLISNNYGIGDKLRLTSNLSYIDTSTGGRGSTSERESTTANLQSRLRVDHRDNFSTHYLVMLRKQEELDWSSKSYTLSAGLSHQLYENLRTSFNLSSTRDNHSNGDLDTDQAHLDLRYNRRIPWGRLTMNFGVRERIRDDQRDGGIAHARAEPHTFVGASTQVFLGHLNVDTLSIVVTDASGSIIFVEGIDYIVDIVGRSTRITRDPFAGIGDDQLILVDYSYMPDPPAKTGLTNINYGINLYLGDYLDLYYQYHQSRERLISGEYPTDLRDETSQMAGMELEWKWSRTRIELEDRDTVVAPWRRFLVRETLAFRPAHDFSFSLGAAYSETELKDTGEITKGLALDANLTWQITSTGQLRTRAFGRRVRSSVQRTESTGVIAIYDWWFGAWRPRVRYEYLNDINDISGDSRKRHGLFLQIERFFR